MIVMQNRLECGCIDVFHDTVDGGDAISSKEGGG